MARVYVAGSSRRWHHAQSVMDDLRAHGHTITEDWTVAFARGEEAARLEDVGARAAIAEDCLRGVLDADAVVAILDRAIISAGMWCEIGYALALAKPVIAVVPHWTTDCWLEDWLRPLVFMAHPMVSPCSSGAVLETLAEVGA